MAQSNVYKIEDGRVIFAGQDIGPIEAVYSPMPGISPQEQNQIILIAKSLYQDKTFNFGHMHPMQALVRDLESKASLTLDQLGFDGNALHAEIWRALKTKPDLIESIQNSLKGIPSGGSIINGMVGGGSGPNVPILGQVGASPGEQSTASSWTPILIIGGGLGLGLLAAKTLGGRKRR